MIITLSDRDRCNISEIQRITFWGFWGNIGLSAIKMFLGVIGHSRALIADSIHSLSDISTDFAVIFGVKYWSKPADGGHPYGHGKFEAIISGIIGFVLLIVAIGLGYNAIKQIEVVHVQQPSWFAFWGAVLSIFLKESLYRWTKKVGKRVKSSAVMANAWHHRSDALSSIPVAMAIAASAISKKWYFLDYLGAFVISLFILYTSYKILQSAYKEIIDAGASVKERERIQEIILGIKGVQSTHALRTRRVGSGWYVDLHIQVDPEITVKEGHDISKFVEERLKKEGPDILDVVVHVEPVGDN